MKSCEKCGIQFENEWKYQRHLSRKTPCDLIIEKNDEFAENMCRSCGHDFSNVYNLKRHLQTCAIHNDIKLQVKIQIEKEYRRKIKELEEENKMLKQELVELKPTDASVNIDVDGDHNNLTLENNVNIYNGDILCFDKESVRELLDILLTEKNGNREQVMKIKEKFREHLSSGNIEGLITYMMNMVHDNDDLPQGKNIFKSKSGPHKDSYIVMGKNGWYKSDPEEVLEIYKAETIKLVGMTSWEPETPKSQRFIDNFNNGDSDERASIAVDKVVSKFKLSKKNPKVKIVERPESDESSYESDSDDDTPPRKNTKKKVLPKPSIKNPIKDSTKNQQFDDAISE